MFLSDSGKRFQYEHWTLNSHLQVCFFFFWILGQNIFAQKFFRDNELCWFVCESPGAQDESMNPSWLGVITLCPGVGRRCPTVTPWDALVSSVHSGGQDVRNPNSPDAASVIGTPAPSLCVSYIPEQHGTVVSSNPKNSLLSEGFLALTSSLRTSMCVGIVGGPLCQFPDIDVTALTSLRTSDVWTCEGLAGKSDGGKNSTCVGIKFDQN